MEQEIELELKNILTYEEFNKICKAFSLSDKDFFTQVNHYFDTEDFALKKLGSALRIREKNNTYMITLKQPYDEGLLESNEVISKDLAEKIIEQTAPFSGEIANILIQLGVTVSNLKYLGSLTTSRAEVDYTDGILVFDHSMYLNHEDYELEYEVKHLNEGNLSFEKLLKEMKIPRRKTKNKIVRFFEMKQSTSR